MEELKKHIKSRLSVLKDQRKSFEPTWKKIAELCSFDAKLFSMDKNNRIRQSVFDTTARNALTYFSAAMKSIITPSTQMWHNLRPTNPVLQENEEVQAYLQYVQKLLFKVRYAPKSQFPYQTDTLFHYLGMFGCSVFFVEEDVGNGIIYRTLPIDEVYISRNDKDVLDAVYREFELTAKEAYENYGESVSKDIKDCLETNPSRKFKFIHAVEPRKDRNIKAKDFTGMPWASYHFEVEADKIIKEGGYRTMPYAAPRFLALPDNPYADSPAQQAFYDMLTANEMAKTILRTGQLQANPPVLARDSLIDSNKLGSAGAVIRGGLDSQGRPAAVSMQYGNNLAITLEMQASIRAQIERAFLVPLFQALTQEKEMTATEVEKREMEKAMLLAPMCERIASEWLSPMIERELDILSQYGYLDGVPDSLMQEGSIAIEYESPYVRMQDSSEILGMYKWIESTMTMAQSDPSVLDIMNFPEASRIIANYYNVNKSAVRTRDEVQALGEQRAQMQQAQNLLGATDVLTKSMKNLKITGSDLSGQ